MARPELVDGTRRDTERVPKPVISHATSMHKLISRLSGSKEPTIQEVGSRLQELGFRGRLVTSALRRARCDNNDGTESPASKPLSEATFVQLFQSVFWAEGRGDVILFAAHDPGAVSHTHPLYEEAVSRGHAALFVPLREGRAWIGRPRAKELLNDAMAMGNVSLVVLGCSVCRAELDVVSECEEAGIPTICMVDWMPSFRLEPAGPCDDIYFLPGHFLVVDNAAKAQLQERYVVGASMVEVIGSPALEAIAHLPEPDLDTEVVRQMYGLRPHHKLLAFFPGSMDGYGEALVATQVLENLAESFSTQEWVVVIRIHPRTKLGVISAVEAACQQHGFFLDDKCSGIGRPLADNFSLLRAADASLSVGSSMSLESLAMGTPSAFFYAGLPDRGEHKESFVQSLPVLRLYNSAQVAGFLTMALQWEKRGQYAEIANSGGAAARGWEAIKKILDSGFRRLKPKAQGRISYE